MTNQAFSIDHVNAKEFSYSKDNWVWRIYLWELDEDNGAISLCDVIEEKDRSQAIGLAVHFYPDVDLVKVDEDTDGCRPWGNHFVVSSDELSLSEVLELIAEAHLKLIAEAHLKLIAEAHLEEADPAPNFDLVMKAVTENVRIMTDAEKEFEGCESKHAMIAEIDQDWVVIIDYPAGGGLRMEVCDAGGSFWAVDLVNRTVEAM